MAEEYQLSALGHPGSGKFRFFWGKTPVMERAAERMFPHEQYHWIGHLRAGNRPVDFRFQRVSLVQLGCFTHVHRESDRPLNLVHRWRRSRGCGWACSFSARDEEELIAADLLQANELD